MRRSRTVRASSRPGGADADLFNPTRRPVSRSDRARPARARPVSARSVAVYAFDTVNVGEQWELSGGLRWDRSTSTTNRLRLTGVATPFERTDRMISWRGGAVFKPRRSRQHLCRRRHVVQSVRRRSRAHRRDRRARAREDEDLRSRDEVGRRRSTAVVDRRRLPHREDQRAHAGPQPGRSADGAGRASSASAASSSARRGRLTDRWTAFGGYSFMQSEIAASNTAAEIDNELALTPDTTLSIWTTFQLPWEIEVGGGAQYMDAVFRNATNTAQVPSYWLINALAAYTVNEHLTLRINANNLADERLRRSHRRRALHTRAPDDRCRSRADSSSSHAAPDSRIRAAADAGCRTRGEFSTRPTGSTAGSPPGISRLAGEAQHADPGGLTRPRAQVGDVILQALNRNLAVSLRGAAAAGVSAAVQPLQRRTVVRHARRQRDAPGARHGAPHPHRSLRHAVSERSRRVRRRRARRRRHLRRARGEAAGRPHGAVSVDQPAPRAPGHPRVRASRRSSGFKAWCATTASARCCSISTPRFSGSAPTCPAIPRRFS